MPFGLGSLIGAGAGLAGGIGKAAVAGGKEARERKLASDTQRYSPWTQLQAQPIEQADPFGDVGSGLAGGAALGQKLSAAIPQAPTPIAAPPVGGGGYDQVPNTRPMSQMLR